MVARRDDGTLVSVYHSGYTYTMGEIMRDEIDLKSDICKGGGIFVHTDRVRAEKQEFPEDSDNATLPRVLLRGYAWGNKKENGKIAAEYFLPTEIATA